MKAVLDGDAVANSAMTRGWSSGIDAGMDEQRAFTGMQEVAQFVGARQIGHRLDAQLAGPGRLRPGRPPALVALGCMPARAVVAVCRGRRSRGFSAV